MKTPVFLCRAAFLGCVIASASAAPAAAAEGDIHPPADYKRLRPGLWEETIQMESLPVAAGDIRAAMESSGLRPEDRARVEAVMKRQQQERQAQGNSMNVGKRTRRSCLTPNKLEDAAAWKLPGDDKGRSDEVKCTQKVTESTSSRLSVRGDCTVADPGAKAGPYAGGGRFATEITFEIKSPELTVTQTSTDGKMGNAPIRTRNSATSRWIGSDCGSVK